jgi:hypothetical protein
MYYSVNADHEGMAAHLTRIDCDRFKCFISELLWNDSEEDGNVRSKCKKALPVKMETVTLIGKGRKNLTCFVY